MATHPLQRRILWSVFASLLVLSSRAPPTTRAEPIELGDPTLCFSEGFYYAFGSGVGGPIFRSPDLVSWRPLGQVFAELPVWARTDIPDCGGYIWAPDIVRIGDEYRLYWSTSTVGSRRSVIGLATNTTLDPASPQYRWVDRGKVIETTLKDNWNAIDPQCFTDREGQIWLALGSYWSGIKLCRLDSSSGHVSPQDPHLHSLAARPGVEPPSIEGAYILWRAGFYYLFVSFDRCHRNLHSDYNVRVGRSRAVTGPYADRDGRALLDGGGTLILASYGAVRGPGHNSVLEHNGQTWLAHHYFNPATGGRRTLQVRPLFWDDDGWPVAGEPLANKPPPPQPPPPQPPSPVGTWDYSLDFGQPLRIQFEADGALHERAWRASWKLEDQRLVLTWRHDGEGRNSPLVERCFFASDGTWFVGRNRYGQIVRGQRQVSAEK